jgi:hypothetical protein
MEISKRYVPSAQISLTFCLIVIQENVLIDKGGVATLGDFGMFSVVDVRDFPIPSRTMHMAPELSAVLPKSGHRTETQHTPSSPTKMSDIYSFAFVILEACSFLNFHS